MFTTHRKISKIVNALKSESMNRAAPKFLTALTLHLAQTAGSARKLLFVSETKVMTVIAGGAPTTTFKAAAATPILPLSQTTALMPPAAHPHPATAPAAAALAHPDAATAAAIQQLQAHKVSSVIHPAVTSLLSFQ